MKPLSPRFVWTVGAYVEEFPDIPADLAVTLWDRQERKPAVTVSDDYAQAFCLERTDCPNGAPFTALQTWFNGLSNASFASEGLPVTQAPPLWQTQFPSFGSLPPIVAAMVASGELLDTSYSGDVCPTFVRASDRETLDSEGSDRLPVLWVDYANPADREFPESPRFRVSSPSFAVPSFETDHEWEAVAHLLQFPAAE